MPCSYSMRASPHCRPAPLPPGSGRRRPTCASPARPAATCPGTAPAPSAPSSRARGSATRASYISWRAVSRERAEGANGPRHLSALRTPDAAVIAASVAIYVALLIFIRLVGGSVVGGLKHIVVLAVWSLQTIQVVSQASAAASSRGCLTSFHPPWSLRCRRSAGDARLLYEPPAAAPRRLRGRGARATQGHPSPARLHRRLRL